MKLEQTHIDQITTAFKKMQSKEDLLQLLNEAKPLVYGDKAKPFQLKQLTWYSNPKLGGKRYAEFKIRKKSGSERSIHAPVRGLKSLQKTLSFVLQCVHEPHHAAMGFVRDKSIVDNAKLHVGSKYVYNIDLKDFFPSVDQARVWKCLQLKPFNLTDSQMTSEEESAVKLKTGIRKFVTEFKEHIFYKIQDNSLVLIIDKKGNYKKYKKRLTGHLVKPNIQPLSLNAEDMGKLREYNQQVNNIIFEDAKRYILSADNIESLNRLVSSRKNLASMIASICCTEIEVERKNQAGEWEKVKRNVLPQGAPTSPVITNIVCQRLDYLLSGVAKRFGLKYSRYADDITFSSMHNVYQAESDFVKELHRIITEQGFHIKESKTRLQKDGYRKEVTGLLVNENANVQKRYIKQLRMWLYYWEAYGYERAYGFFLQQYLVDKGHIVKGKPDMTNVIAGKLDYLKMVKGNENELYTKLKVRFDELIDKPEVKTDGSIERSKEENVQSPLVGLNSVIKTNSILEIAPSRIVTEAKNIPEKLKININSLNSKIEKLKRDIFYRKGESLPIEDFLENLEKEEKVIDLSKHKPKDVTSFLMNFRKSEGIKFLTHEFDKPNSTFKWVEILSIAKKEYDDARKLYVIPQALSYRVSWFGFIENAKPFRFLGNVHRLNWHSQELTEWFDSNPGKHPAAESSPFRNSMIIPFRKSYEIKSPELEELIVKKLSEKGMYTKFDFGVKNERLINLDKANFYTDVDSLDRGLGYLFNSINQRVNNSNQLKIEFSGISDMEGRKRIIKIVHIDSVCNKPLDKNELFQGDLLEAEKAFFGICDWSIISKSPDESVNKLNILFDINSNKSPKEKVDDSSIEGFTHILTFYS